jgi:integrase/recombinase XerD
MIGSLFTGGPTMFETLFGKASTVIHHQSAPYAAERERYLAHCLQEGYKPVHVKQIAAVLLAVVYEMRDYDDLRIDEQQLQAMTERAARMHRKYSKAGNIRAFHKIFSREARRLLRFLGRFQEPTIKPMRFADRLEDFTAWMEHERGLSPATIDIRRRYGERFLRWFEERQRPFSSICLKDIDQYLAAYGARGLSRIAISDCAKAIRAFLKHAGFRNWCSPSVAEGMRGPRIYRQESLPSGPSWENVKRLLLSLDTDKPVDIRNRAIVTLIATYGFRTSEIANLRLEDIDWERDQIVVPRGKTRQSASYPLVPEAGKAIVRYL